MVKALYKRIVNLISWKEVFLNKLTAKVGQHHASLKSTGVGWSYGDGYSLVVFQK